MSHFGYFTTNFLSQHVVHRAIILKPFNLPIWSRTRFYGLVILVEYKNYYGRALKQIEEMIDFTLMLLCKTDFQQKCESICKSPMILLHRVLDRYNQHHPTRVDISRILRDDIKHNLKFSKIID
jgi:hypothetical protein